MTHRVSDDVSLAIYERYPNAGAVPVEIDMKRLETRLAIGVRAIGVERDDPVSIRGGPLLIDEVGKPLDGRDGPA